jgi:hypothetical protein
VGKEAVRSAVQKRFDKEHFELTEAAKNQALAWQQDFEWRQPQLLRAAWYFHNF